jgi:hypothetical protein
MVNRASFVLAACIAGLGCSDSTPPVVCQPILISAFQVTVRDATTGLFIGSQSTVIAALRGGSADTVAGILNSPDSSVLSAGSRPGTYDVTVRHVGYVDWTKGNILVPSADDGCHPVTQVLQANLQKSP